MQERGLEIIKCKDYGPHTRYYPYIVSENEVTGPLVTADDRTIYPDYWLCDLVKAHCDDPSVIYCYQAQRMHVINGIMYPYNEWEFCSDTVPAHQNFINGDCGVIYPAQFLEYLRLGGKSFIECCHQSDDVWLTVNALRGGFKIGQLYDKPIQFDRLKVNSPGDTCFYNVISGGLHQQITKTFSDSDISKIES